jgi:hypothetical protein
LGSKEVGTTHSKVAGLGERGTMVRAHGGTHLVGHNTKEALVGKYSDVSGV